MRIRRAWAKTIWALTTSTCDRQPYGKQPVGKPTGCFFGAEESSQLFFRARTGRIWYDTSCKAAVPVCGFGLHGGARGYSKAYACGPAERAGSNPAMRQRNASIGLVTAGNGAHEQSPGVGHHNWFYAPPRKGASGCRADGPPGLPGGGYRAGAREARASRLPPVPLKLLAAGRSIGGAQPLSYFFLKEKVSKRTLMRSQVHCKS